MIRLICTFVGAVFCLFGLLGMLTPIPFGLVFFIIGLMFIIPVSPGATRLVRSARRRIGVFDRVLTAATKKAPAPYRRILRKTEIDAFDW